MKKNHSIDMCSGSLADKILLFALPLMASSLLQLLFNAADVVVVGWFAGKEALAAVGSNTSLINLLISLFVGLSMGTNVVLAHTGSCIHPSGITGIEIENRCMTLVKWSISVRPDLSLYAAREILGETVCVDEISV